MRVLLPVLIAAGAVAGGPAQAQSFGDAAKPDPGRTTEDPRVVLDSQIAAYRNAYPGIAEEQARLSAEQQDERKLVYEELLKDGGRGFGGAWYEPTTGVLHVNVTNGGAERRAQDAARSQGVTVETHRVQRSEADLASRAERVRKGNDKLAKAAKGQVGYDVTTNTVVVAVPADQLAELEADGVPEGVTVVADPQIVTEEDYGCTSRTACDYTIRAGSALWRSSTGNDVCSVGFTGRDSWNRRYTLTAGHCSNGNNVTWGTGTAAIGPMYASADSGALDAAIIQVTNPWFTSDAGGEIYQTLSVNYVAPTLSYITAGETVCLSANFTDPAGGNRCGVVGTNSDPAMRGMVRVNGLDACGGDSGGGWYWLASSTYRVAYGLHSRSDTGCNVSGGRSWFTAVPTVKSWAPWLAIETR